MGRTLYDGEGNEISVLDDTELASLKEKAAKAEEYEKQQVTLEEEIKQLKDAANPNWPEIRRKLSRLDALEQKGKEVNDAGDVVEKGVDETRRIAEEAARKGTMSIMLETKKSDLLAGIPDEKRQTVSEIYASLTAGKDVQLSEVESYMFMARRAAGVSEGQNRSPMSYSGGFSAGGDSDVDNKKDFSDTPEGKIMSERLGLKFANKK